MDENPYEAPVAQESKPATRIVRSGLGWQVIGLMLYIVAMLPCCMSMPLSIATGALAMDPERDPRMVIWPNAVTGVVFALLGAAMLWGGYKIRRATAPPPDDESATPP